MLHTQKAACLCPPTFPPSSLLPPALTRPDGDPAWAKAGLEERRVVLVLNVTHSAASCRDALGGAAPAAVWDWGYTAKPSASLLEAISEAQRGR